jgi:hypothetical protein
MRVKLPTVDLETAFRTLEEYKIQGVIVNYNMSQNTLEQVFIKYARAQEAHLPDTDTGAIASAAAISTAQ